jgi:hypothetical protein
VPFDWKRFPKEFVAGLEGRWENSVPVYDLSLAEDPLTHETLFYNAAGEPILRLPAPAWSDPADLRLTLASLYGVTPGSADAALFDARLWDPSRLQARLTTSRPTRTISNIFRKWSARPSQMPIPNMPVIWTSSQRPGRRT